MQEEYSREGPGEHLNDQLPDSKEDRDAVTDVLHHSVEFDGKIIYKRDDQLMDSNQAFSAGGPGGLSSGQNQEQNTQQMFYGDFQCDEDEPPEEDDMSK